MMACTGKSFPYTCYWCILIYTCADSFRCMLSRFRHNSTTSQTFQTKLGVLGKVHLTIRDISNVKNVVNSFHYRLFVNGKLPLDVMGIVVVKYGDLITVT